MLTPTELKSALEGRNAAALVDFYADNAVIRIIDRDHPPSRPLELRGKSAIGDYYDDVCGRAMTHHVESAIAAPDQLAFSESCAYPNGTRVFCAAMARTADGKIVEQTTVQAWDS
jgi:hypothetical protein